MRVEFNELKNIVKDRSSKLKRAEESSACLRGFIASVINLIESCLTLMQDEMANVIMSLQNWVIRRSFTSYKRGDVKIGDIFYADLGLNYVPEYSYHHPVIVLEKIGNRVMVVPVSTSPDNISNAYHPIDNPTDSKYLRKVYGNDYGQNSDGFEKTGAVLLSDLKVISQGRLIEKKGELKNINNKDSLFQEIKNKVFALTFPRQNIELYNAKRDYEILKVNFDSLKNEHNRLIDEYNILKEQIKAVKNK